MYATKFIFFTALSSVPLLFPVDSTRDQNTSTLTGETRHKNRADKS